MNDGTVELNSLLSARKKWVSRGHVLASCLEFKSQLTYAAADRRRLTNPVPKSSAVTRVFHWRNANHMQINRFHHLVRFKNRTNGR